MANSTKFFLFFISGLVITAFGVGGVENSLTFQELVSGISVSGLGLLMMYMSTVYAPKEQ